MYALQYRHVCTKCRLASMLQNEIGATSAKYIFHEHASFAKVSALCSACTDTNAPTQQGVLECKYLTRHREFYGRLPVNFGSGDRAVADGLKKVGGELQGGRRRSGEVCSWNDTNKVEVLSSYARGGTSHKEYERPGGAFLQRPSSIGVGNVWLQRPKCGCR